MRYVVYALLVVNYANTTRDHKRVNSVGWAKAPPMAAPFGAQLFGAVPTIRPTVRVSREGGGHGAQTRAHSASKTRVNALVARPHRIWNMKVSVVNRSRSTR
jgi:hypothetical protein